MVWKKMQIQRKVEQNSVLDLNFTLDIHSKVRTFDHKWILVFIYILRVLTPGETEYE